LPTFFLVFLLTFYLKKVFFQPLEKVLQQRYLATEGARKLADKTFELASAKAAEYEAAMRAARAEIYKTQEQAYKELQERHGVDAAAARERAGALVREARVLLDADVETARAALAADAQSLAGRIADSILRRSAA
jgi:F-type H+-transporting ATPase subunit b